jgi:hypothetical protein
MLRVIFWVVPRRVVFNSRHSGTLCLLHLHRRGDIKCVKLERPKLGLGLSNFKQTQCSETSVIKHHTPWNNPKYYTQHLEHGESLKSRSISGWLLGVRFSSLNKIGNVVVGPYPLVQSCPRIHWLCIRGSPRPEKKYWKNYRNKRSISFKTPAKRERAVTWWNPEAQTRPVPDSSSLAPVLTLSRRTCFHSASRVLAVCISCRVIAVFCSDSP